jgi:lysophospholipase L1-like esterase
MLGAAPLLEKQLPGIVIDCKIGRQMSQASEIVNQLRVDGKLGNRLIIQLGTNGSFPTNKLDSLLRSLEKIEHILLINTRVPRPWEDEVNTALSEVGAKYKNVTLIDWHTASRNKDSYFYEDGVHLTSEGAEQYASLLIDAMKP